MTPKQLNSRIKKFGKRYLTELKKPADEFFNWLNTEGTEEFNTLCGADQEMKYINKQSILILMRINMRHRLMPFHRFGMMVNVEDWV